MQDGAVSIEFEDRYMVGTINRARVLHSTIFSGPSSKESSIPAILSL